MSSARAPILVALLFVGLTIAFQPGLARHVGHAFPMMGHLDARLTAENDVPRDSLIDMGILAHVAHALTHDPAKVFQWPVFYPHRNTLAYADHMLAQAVFSLPLWLATPRIALVHNLLLLASFVGCGVGTWLLVRHLTGSTAAGIVAGILFAFSPQRAHDLDHIQVLWSFWIPLALVSLHCWAETGRWRHAFGFALLATAQCLSSLYLGLYFLTLALPLGAWLLARSGLLRRPRTWAQAMAGAAVAAALLIPLSLPYLVVRDQMGFTRTLAEARYFSVGLGLYLEPYPGTWLYQLMGHAVGAGELPGLVPLVLVVLGTATLRSGGSAGTAASRRSVAFYLVWTLIAILLSGGPSLRLWGDPEGPTIPGPFLLLFRYVPPFHGTRAVARFVYLVVLGMAVLAGFGVAWLLPRLRRSWLQAATAVALAGVCFLEMRIEPPELYRDRIPRGVPAATRWLAERDPGDAIVELPANPFFEDALYVYLAGYHHRPLVNGSSAYLPAATFFLEERMRRFPAPAAVRLMNEVGVRYVVQHDKSWKPPPWLADALPVPVFTDGSTRIFEVPTLPPVEPGVSREPVEVTGVAARSDAPGSYPRHAVDGEDDTAWKVTSRPSPSKLPYLLIDLGTETRIAGIRIRPGPDTRSSWTIRVETSLDGGEFHIAARELEPVSLETFVQRPGEALFEAHFPPQTVRFLKLTNPGFWGDRWSVAGIALYSR